MKSFGNTTAHLRHHTPKIWRRELSKTTKANVLAPNTAGSLAEDNDNSIDSASLLFMIRAKLTDENIDSFVNLVEDIYKQSFESHYKGFTVINYCLANWKNVKRMHDA